MLSIVFILSAVCTTCGSSSAAQPSPISSTTIPENIIIKVAIIPHGMLKVSELETALQNGDIFLVNVHIPFEGNIPDTDLFIPYNEVLDNANLFLADKDQKSWCTAKVGSMGDAAAQDLISLGYTNV